MGTRLHSLPQQAASCRIGTAGSGALPRARREDCGGTAAGTGAGRSALTLLHGGVLGIDLGELPQPRPPRLLDQLHQTAWPDSDGRSLASNTLILSLYVDND